MRSHCRTVLALCCTLALITTATLPQLQTGDLTYSAEIAGRLERSYGPNFTAVLDLQGRCGPEPLSANLRIPVPNLREGLTITRH